MIRDPWFPGRGSHSGATTRLLCLPYAGGSAAIYHAWQHLAPSEIEVCPVELPGRGSRGREAPFRDLRLLVHELTEAVVPLLDRPCAFFGHSMGGLLAFELARSLRRRGGPQPAHLFVSAAPGPARREGTALHTAPDAELIAYLRRLGGTPQAVLANDELMQLVLPVLRADFAVLETYEYYREEPLSVPITVIGGSQDTMVPPSRLTGWRDQTTRPDVRLLPGGHFFLHDLGPELLRLVQTGMAPEPVR